MSYCSVLVLLSSILCFAQFQSPQRHAVLAKPNNIPQFGGSWGGGRGWRGGSRRPLPSREEFPNWEIDAAFAQDVFTFVRIQFDSDGPFGWHDRWDNDYPDSEWNFSFRIQQLTSLQVDPNGRVLRLTDKEIFDFPFIYFAGVQYMRLGSQEQEAFRRYLQNGGFFMMDDLWALDSRENVLREMRQVLPDIQPRELSLEHPIFHNVYDLKEFPQVTDYQTWSQGARFEYAHLGQTGDSAPHFIAYIDDNERMLGLICHNNDIGDGWEREGDHHEYFQTYSLKHSYPFGINLITYVMSH